jgi:glycine cleavage system aminomethyltransferase T
MYPPSPFAAPSPVPFLADQPLFHLDGSTVRQWEFAGFKPETLSWKKTCYIHGGLSMPGQIVYRGPDATRFMAGVFVNGFDRFGVGRAKHGVACDENGLIAGHGVIQRTAPDEYHVYVAGTWTLYAHANTNLDVEQVLLDRFLFQVAGPTAIDTLEAAAGESLRDIGFLRYRQVNIAGHSVQIMRLGMAGTLAYELHGPTAIGPEVFEAVYRAGQPFGIERLGWKNFPVNHVEGGFPQQFWTFTPSVHDHAGYQAFRASHPWLPGQPEWVGSAAPDNHRARYRTPLECGWGKSIVLDHDFTGREAVERELAAPRRTVVTLEWNADDVVDIYASHLREGAEYKYLEIPAHPSNVRTSAHADVVHLNGREVGFSGGTVYSYHFRKVISLATIDLDQAAIGTELVLDWGDHGGPIKPVRVRVARFPYLDEGRNNAIDLSAPR